jgi:hypothetical protein
MRVGLGFRRYIGSIVFEVCIGSDDLQYFGKFVVG